MSEIEGEIILENDIINSVNLTIYPYLEYLLEPPRLGEDKKDDGYKLSYRIANPHLDMYYDDYVDEKLVFQLQQQGLSDEEICELEIKKRFDYINTHYDANQLNILLDDTFYQQSVINVATSKEFVNKLLSDDILVINKEFIEEHNPCCGICQSPFKELEKAVMLPCKNSDNQKTPHYFHIGDNPDDCLGIKPWLDMRSTCPVCRFSFPNIEILEEEVFELEIDEVEENNIDSFSMEQDDIIDCSTVFSNMFISDRCLSNPPERCLNPICIENRAQIEIDKVNQEMIDKAMQISIEHSILNTDNNCLLEDQQKIFKDIDLVASEDALLESIILQSLENF